MITKKNTAQDSWQKDETMGDKEDFGILGRGRKDINRFYHGQDYSAYTAIWDFATINPRTGWWGWDVCRQDVAHACLWDVCCRRQIVGMLSFSIYLFIKKEKSK